MSSVTGGAVPAWQDALPHALWRAQQAVHRRLQTALDGLDVTPTQLGLAVHLDELGAMSASDLARLFRLTPQSVTTALAQLERLGWIRRLPHPVHKRIILNELTETGLTGVADGRARVTEIDRFFAEILGDDGRGEAVAWLQKLTVALEGEDPPPAGTWPVNRGAS
ncbi:MarR family transcriptional regulator [Streptomyces sp. NBC_01275]|uniref:MarR family winged helix-turn-helix transcriptional regulator n=1 Tax=Streptomyces sp. NBC_01275 TaxID=2903807 RepID=UPI002257CDF8|nr:MarR family transcriptional regulator [Streptomyces sp. NBC_01275]MCX4767267.1 MarR family transcriptional regulator [Streptomyces sp. NBC_01275]